MAQLMEAIGWLVLFVAGPLALVLTAGLCLSFLAPLLDSSADPLGYGLVLPLIGRVLIALPGMLVGWGLIEHARRRRGFRQEV